MEPAESESAPTPNQSQSFRQLADIARELSALFLLAARKKETVDHYLDLQGAVICRQKAEEVGEIAKRIANWPNMLSSEIEMDRIHLPSRIQELSEDAREVLVVLIKQPSQS